MIPERPDLEARVVQIVAEALDQPPSDVRLHSSLLDDLGAESIDFLDLLFRLESAFGIKIPEQDMWKGAIDATSADSIRQHVDALRAEMPEFRWDRLPASTDARRPAAPHHGAHDRRLPRAAPGQSGRGGSVSRTMSPHGRRVVVTGLGVVSAAGREPHAFWGSLVAGHSAIRRMGGSTRRPIPRQIAAEIDGFTLPEPLGFPAHWPEDRRITTYAASAASAALEDARVLHEPGACDRTGVAIAAGLGSYDHEEVFAACSTARAQSDEFDWPAFTRTLDRDDEAEVGRSGGRPGSIPALLANHYGFRGPVMA